MCSKSSVTNELIFWAKAKKDHSICDHVALIHHLHSSSVQYSYANLTKGNFKMLKINVCLHLFGLDTFLIVCEKVVFLTSCICGCHL